MSFDQISDKSGFGSFINSFTGLKLHIIIMFRVVGVLVVALECRILLFGACLSVLIKKCKQLHKFTNAYSGSPCHRLVATHLYEKYAMRYIIVGCKKNADDIHSHDM